MAAIASTDWTLTVQNEYILSHHRRTFVKLVMSATKALTYPSSGGIALPTTLGMRRNIDNVLLIDPGFAVSTKGSFVFQYDKSVHAIRAYGISLVTTFPAAANVTGFPEFPTTMKVSMWSSTPSSYIVYAEVIGW